MTQTLIVPTLICENCGGPFQSAAYQARYCTLKCKQSAAIIRRRLRENGVPSAAKRLQQSHLPADVPAIDPEELERKTAYWKAKMAGEEPPPETTAEPKSTAIIGELFSVPRPQPKTMEDTLLEDIDKAAKKTLDDL